MRAYLRTVSCSRGCPSCPTLAEESDSPLCELSIANERVRESDALPTPAVSEADDGPSFRYVTLSALVRMKLTSFRRKDHVHILDLIEVGLVDETARAGLPPELVARLAELLENPGS